MEDRKAISIGKLAALERARALGFPVRVPTVSAFEHQAREWKRQPEVQRPMSDVRSPKSEVRSPKSKGQSPRPPRLKPRDTRRATPEVENPGAEVESDEQYVERRVRDTEFKTEDPVSSVKEGFNWQPYKSNQGKVGKKPKDLNPASVALIARKIMAREWAMALGRGCDSVEDENAVIERKAEQLMKKKESERERKEIEEKRANKQRKVLEGALRSFGRALLTASKPVTPETAEAFLEAALTDTGEFISITWQEDGCRILIEPWEEKKLRRKSGETVPAVFQATIDENLMLGSFEKIQDPQLLQETQNDIILKNILSSFRNSPQKDFHAFENSVSEGGRIIKSTKADGGWKMEVEPWEEMRIRNVERGGQPPVVTYVIKTDKAFERITCARGR